ncbi:hypothetical protein TSUD_304460 [Trifolium subterraneum]|uniref:Uncharacterized protein n=1 Tax=Trifolium subterraneum TaxID=3900 RepID=A0A2Z6ME34_TRISU|nr:hypothetical protein TSUD_304460 [Trifolium subterraneum]
MVYPCSMQFSPDVRLKTNNNGPRSFQHHNPALVSRLHLVTMNLLPRTLKRDSLALQFLSGVHAPIRHAPSRCGVFVCRSAMLPGGGNGTALAKSASVFLTSIQRRGMIERKNLEMEILGGTTEVEGSQNNPTINHLALFAVDQHNEKEE